MTSLWYDIRHGFRVLFNNPGFAAVAVLALALGVGANSAIYSAINAVLLRPLPFPNPDRLVWVWETQPRLDKAPFTPADFLDYQAQNRSFESVTTYFTQSLTLTGAGEPERFRGAIVMADFFSTLGVGAHIGRTFLPEEGEPGAKRVAVISDGFWRRRFGADPGVVGKDLTLNGVAFTVVGVMPQDFRYPSAGQLLRKDETQNQARALLDELVTAANKGPDTVVTARALLSAAYLYLSADPARAATVFADAVKCINRIKSPGFSRQSQVRKLEGRGFAHYAIFKTPGFDPEAAFRELAKADFDGALSLAGSLADKPLRALTTLALADYCLARAAQQGKGRKGKRG